MARKSAPKRTATHAARKEWTVQAAGSKGGRTVSAKYGPAFYQKIGKMGGEKLKKYVAAGKKA